MVTSSAGLAALSGMTEPTVLAPSAGLTEEAREEMRRLLVDDTLRASRHRYVDCATEVLVSVGDWLAVDSWLGGGKVVDVSSLSSAEASTYTAFCGVATVVAMSAELAETAASMAGRQRYFAVGAALRQLIECEYLVTLFDHDLDWAEKWMGSSPAEIRASFTPGKMRKRLSGYPKSGFSEKEYWGHCDTGGHPAPKGAPLVERLDPARTVWPYRSAELLIDLGFHLDRIWRATDRLLVAHHARYATVRSQERDKASAAWKTWLHQDPVAAILVEALDTSPTA